MNNVDILGQPSVSKHNLWLNLTKVLLIAVSLLVLWTSQFRNLIEDHQRVVLARIFPKLSSWLRFFVESHFPFRLGLPSLILVSQLLRVACFANHWVVRFFSFQQNWCQFVCNWKPLCNHCSDINLLR